MISADELVSRRLLQVTVSWHTHPSGQVTVGPAPDDFLMSRFIGQSIRAVHRIIDHRIETEIGLRLELDHGEVRILNLGDELVITDTALPDALEAALR
ncbi:hypothetical protein ACFPOI_21680 [Nonomuraea angiospora]|uniref:Uncharacterized protein n=1 Tax=Nonomuraea angiospora TaxID=46172 RepID=A0ABR9MKK5_9ACTN|nr:hypothetical protein [Nonomuraea angiospora]